jgi:signal transduction histidine kinase
MLSPQLCRCDGGRETDDDGRSVRELREANRHMREFLALVVHELSNPVAAIRYALGVLEHQGENAAKRDWVRNLVDRQAHCIGRIVADLLDASRIEHGKLRLSKRPVDVARVVDHAVETTRAAVAGRGHRLEVGLPAEPVSLDADPVRLEQVLTNLLTNAAKYTEPGGRIRLTAEVEGTEVVFRVRDSGIGIAPEMLPHVFDPFWQVERTLDRAQGGLGIGLALVRQVAELHGGSATASSAGLHRGSEFVVRVPADPVPTGHAPANRHE